MPPEKKNMSTNQPRLLPVFGLLAALAVIFVLTWAAPPHDVFSGLANYDPLHVLLETLATVMAGLVFGVVWNADNRERAGNIVVLGCALLAAAIVDFMHMMSYAGMPDLVTPAGPEKAINFWLAARFIVATALLVVALRDWRPFRLPRTRYLWLAGSLLLAGLIAWVGLYHQALFPRTFIPGKGLTPVKIGAEYTIIALLIPSALIFLRNARRRAPYDAVSLFAAAVISIMSELSFTLYSNVTDTFNLLGHLYKVVAYIFIFRAVFIESVREPFSRLRDTQAELQRAVAALRASEGELRAAQRVAAMGSWTLDALRGVVTWSEEIYRILGVDPQQPVPTYLDHQQYLTPNGFAVINAAVEKIRRDGEPFQCDLELLRPDGERRWLAVRGEAVRDAGGAVVGVRGTAHDITERKLAAQALWRSEEKFRSMVETTSDWIWEIDESARYTYASPQVSALLGYQPEEMIGRSPFDFMPPQERERVRETVGRYVAERKPFSMIENTNIHKDGTAVILETSGMPVFDDSGVYRGYRGIDRDITLRKRAEEALRESEEQFRTITNAAQDGIVMMDGNGAVVFWNRAAERIFGYSSAEAIGLPLHNVLAPPRYRDAFRDGFSGFVETGNGAVIGKTLELTAVRKGGGEFPIELSVSAVQRGGRWNVIGVLRDITERKRAEITLRKLNRTLTTLSHGNEALVRAVDETSLLQAVCDVLVRDGMYLMVWVGYAETEAGEPLRVMARAGEGSAFLDETQSQTGDPAAAAIRTGVVQVEQNVAAKGSLAPWAAQVAAHDVSGAAAFPLAMQGNVFGALVVYAATAGAFDTPEVDLLQELAGDLAYGIEMLRTQAERDRMREDLKAALSGTIEAVARMVEKRDPYTAGHQQRVAELAAAIAGEMALEPRRIEGIRLGGLIHDIGKISIPAEILSRPGRLVQVEFEIVKTHAQIGYDIIKDVHFPWPIGDMVWQHHERLDGSGYPLGLKGDQIVEEARILAVADVVEAMASHRPYRPGLGVEAALAEIEQGRGRLYCPQAVDACLRLFREKQFAWTAAGDR